MKLAILFLPLFLLGCTPSEPAQTSTKYPGNQPMWETCHNLWDLEYKIDVAACENHFNNPKYKRGQKVKVKQLADSCHALTTYIDWSGPQNKPFYRYQAVCNGKNMDEDCNLSCPIFGEDDVIKETL